MTPDAQPQSRLASAAQIVAAYLENNSVQPGEIPDLIRDVHTALLGLNGQPVQVERQLPAVSIKKSLTPDYLISLEDGRRYKSLKRHLAVNGLTPMEYRLKWGLPPDYPMVAPSYAKQRSELALAIGLGRRAAAPAPVSKSARNSRSAR